MRRRHGSVIDQALEAHARATERQKAKAARKAARYKKRCKKQIAVLEGLRPWATRCEMWWDHSTDAPLSFRLSIYRGHSRYWWIQFDQLGKIAILNEYHDAFSSASFWWHETDWQMWDALRRISIQDILKAADDAAYGRGAGRNTVIPKT